MKWRVLVALLSALLLAGVALGYVLLRKADAPPTQQISLTEPGLLVRDTRSGHVGIRGKESSALGDLQCARVYAAAGTGVCLRVDPLSPSTFEIAVLDADLHVKRQIPLVGVPSRARVSASGRMIAWTVFVTGDSYNGGQFSTRSGILDTRDGTLVGTLEDFTVPEATLDRNFWGVTFAPDDNRFYATMSSSGHRYLVEGDFAGRIMHPLKDNVECPSLSPDAKRLVYKKRVSEDPQHMWRLTVLDLATMAETPLAETRNVDDQAVWLDDHTIGYAVTRGSAADVWAVPADGSGTPTLLAPDAESPAPLHFAG